MPVVTNTGGDLHFPGLHLRHGDNMVSSALWESAKLDAAVTHYLRLGRLRVGVAAKKEAAPPPTPPVEPKIPEPKAEPEAKAALPFSPPLPEARPSGTMPKPQVVDYSGVSARQLCEMVKTMDEQQLRLLLASGEQRKTVMRAVEVRYAIIAVGG